MNMRAATSATLCETFQKEADTKPGKRTTVPFSLRFTPEERAWLDEQAGYRPLGDYIRAKLLGEFAEKRRVLRKPKDDDRQLGVILAMLGDTRLSSNLNQLAKHANFGTLDVSDEVEAELQEACAAVIAMRDALFTALGYKPKNKQENDE